MYGFWLFDASCTQRTSVSEFWYLLRVSNHHCQMEKQSYHGSALRQLHGLGDVSKNLRASFGAGVGYPLPGGTRAWAEVRTLFRHGSGIIRTDITERITYRNRLEVRPSKLIARTLFGKCIHQNQYIHVYRIPANFRFT